MKQLILLALIAGALSVGIGWGRITCFWPASARSSYFEPLNFISSIEYFAECAYTDAVAMRYHIHSMI